MTIDSTRRKIFEAGVPVVLWEHSVITESGEGLARLALVPQCVFLGDDSTPSWGDPKVVVETTHGKDALEQWIWHQERVSHAMEAILEQFVKQLL